MTPSTLQTKAFLAKLQGQEDLSCSPVLQPQQNPKLHPLWCHPAESSDRQSRWGYCRPHLLQDYVKMPKQITMNAETFHYWCRLLRGRADRQVQSLGHALLPSAPLRRAPIMAEQHPGSRTPGRYLWAQAHLLSAQSSTP